MPSQEVVVRPGRQSDYSSIPLQRPIVIDNGAYHCRVGWGGEEDPRLSFRNILNRPRQRTSGELVSLVGEFDPNLVKLFDFTRSSIRSPFDGNVVYQFETMESILDYAFDRMGVDATQIEHPILMTEGACNPLSSRNRMAELLFETYGVPSLAFGIDGVFGYVHNQKLGVCERDGLLVNIGHQTTHVIPIVAGEPVLEAACRTSVGGFQVTSYLKRLLSLQYPYHVNSITWEKAEGLKQEHCYIAEDYPKELSIFEKGGSDAEAKTRWWQLPWTPPVVKEQSEEELARKAAIKEKQGQRLRDMANAKRESKIADLEANVQGLEYLLQELDDAADEKQEASILLPSGYNSRAEVQAALTKVSASLRKAKGQPAEAKPLEEDMIPDSERYPLLDIPNSQLTAEQIKEKKKQKFLKITTEGRIRAKQKRHELNLQREREQQLEEERRLANPELYLEELRARQAEQAAKVEQRKRQKTGAGPGGGNGAPLTSGAGGRGERLNTVQKERMKLLTSAAFDRGKEEDTFGLDDEDWQLYKRMSKDADDVDEEDEQEAELVWLTNRLKELDPSFVPLSASDPGGGQPATTLDPLQQRPRTMEDFRISLAAERFRCPEIIMQPAMMGVDRAGLGEAVGVALRRLPPQYRDQVMNGSILLTGGSSLFEGLDQRMLREIRQTRPLGSNIKVVRGVSPLLDAWRGASTFASESFERYSFTKADYEERGPEWLRYYNVKYSAGLSR